MADSVKSVDIPAVHGMVVVNPDGSAVGAPVGGATASNQTNGSQKTQIVDSGGEAVTVTGGKLDVNASIDTTGLATSAKQDTIIGHVDGIETSLTSIDGKITAVNTGAVVVSSSALPSGAATAAKQPALGTAGTASADVLTVQGIASMTALKVDGSAVTQPVSGTVTADLGSTDNAVLDTIASNTTYGATTGGGTETGALRVTLANNSTGVVSVDDNGGALTVDGTVAATQSGTWNVGTVTAVTAISNALPSGTNAIGKLAANSGVDIGDVTLTAGTAAIGTILPPDIDVTTHTNYAKKYYTSTGAATDGIIWSPAAGKRWHVVSLIINTSAATTVTLEDDKAGGDEVIMKLDLAANSGIAYNFTEHYPLASGEDAADLLVTTSAGNIYITAIGYEI